ncbi:MAG: hypothetical protein ACRBK7_01335 [Acidimicrobiales bacterium]
MESTSTARNPRAEAQVLAGDGFAARVLEPSPPAILDDNFFADDPVSVDDLQSGATAVLPTGVAGKLDWDRWLADHPEHASWAAERWLGGPRSLPTPPAGLTATRIDLHRLAAYVIAPARHAANGKFGLRWTLGGFGTPLFASDEGDRQVRVEGTNLVDQRGDSVSVAPITTLAAAEEFLGSTISSDAGAEPDSPEIGDVNAALTVDPAAADFLGQWFGMAFAALESVRSDPASVDPSRVQLWPGHFDPAIEVGDEDHRASYGASPGDPGIDEPYLYVSIWWPDRVGASSEDPAWNAPSFTGAILKLSDFPEGVDPVTAAADFWTTTRDRLG